MSQLNTDNIGTTDGQYRVSVRDLIGVSAISPESFGAKGDDLTNDTVAITNAINYAVNHKTPLRLGPKTYRVTSLVIPDNLIMFGTGRSTVLKKVQGSTTPVLVSKSNPTLASVVTNNNAESLNFFLSSFQIDGGWEDEGTQAIAGALLSFSGSTIEYLDIKNVYGHGLVTSGGNINPTYGMEGTMRSIRIDRCGMNGWYASGPHDSVVENLIVIDSGQLANNTYYGILTLSTMNYRGNALHVWHRSDSLRNKYACFAQSWGDDILNSHFEGAYESQLVITGQNNNYSNCKSYANWNPATGFSNVVIRSPNNRYSGSCGGPGEGKADCFGVALGDGTAGEYPANCYINITVINTKLGGVDFTHEQGHNQVFLSGYCNNNTGTAFGGSLVTKGTSYLLSTVPEYYMQYFNGDKKP